MRNKNIKKANRTFNHLFITAEGRLKAVLADLGVEKTSDVMKITEQEVKSLPLCGQKTWLQVKKLQDALMGWESTNQKKEDEKHRRLEKITQELEIGNNFKEFPLFARKKKAANTVSPPSIPTIEEIPLSRFSFPARAKGMFEKLGMKTLGELLYTTPSQLLEKKNFGVNTLYNVRNIIRQTMANFTLQESEAELEWTSFRALLHSLLKIYAREERDIEIAAKRLGFQHNKISTYHEIAEEFNVTRERIRQIWTPIWDKLSSMEGRNRLRPFWDVVLEVLENNGGISRIEDIWEELCSHFNWQDEMNFFALKKFMELWPQIKINRKLNCIMLLGYPCLSCSTINQQLRDDIAHHNGDIPLNEALKNLRTICENKCLEEKIPLAPEPSLDLVRFHAQNSHDMKMEAGKLFSFQHWQITHGYRIKDVAKATLEDIGEPIHYSELAKIIRKHNNRFSDIPDSKVHNCLISHSHFVLANRGTYGLPDWHIKPYMTHAQAIMKLLEKRGRPVGKDEILSTLTKKGFKEANLRAAFYSHPRIVRVKKNTYRLGKK